MQPVATFITGQDIERLQLRSFIYNGAVAIAVALTMGTVALSYQDLISIEKTFNFVNGAPELSIDFWS